jgi:outer membrane protein assembly factor BamD (BamD/ComL family)
VKALALLLVFAVTEEAEFYRGMALERDGKWAEAVAVFRALVARAPADAFADDALLEIGHVEEEQLDDPVAALAAYERLARDYPDSRLVVRATRRAEELRAQVESGAEAARAWGAIFYGFPGRPRAETIAQVEGFLAKYPDFAAAPRASYWLATLLRDEGRGADALARARTVEERWPADAYAARARKLEGDLLLAAGDLDGAAAAYGPEGAGRVRRERWRTRGLIASWSLLGACALAAVAIVRSPRRLVRSPTEAIYLLPVVALFAGAGLTEHRAIGHAVAIIAAGGLATAWLSGAALEAARARGPLRGRRVAAHIVLAVLAVLAVCNLALAHERLFDQLEETLRFGADK